MPNLIPIDFYAEGKSNTINPLGCLQYCFSGKCGYICPGHRGCLWGRWLWSRVHETLMSLSVILELSVLGYAIRDWKSAGSSSRGSFIRRPSLQRAYVYMAGGQQMGQQWKPPGEDRSKRVRATPAFSLTGWARRSSSGVGPRALSRGFGQIRQRDQGRCWFMKQVDRRHWEGCMGCILAYLIWCELATKKTQEIRDESACTPIPLRPPQCGRAACGHSSASLWTAATRKLTLQPPTLYFNLYVARESFLNCNSCLYLVTFTGLLRLNALWCLEQCEDASPSARRRMRVPAEPRPRPGFPQLAIRRRFWALVGLEQQRHLVSARVEVFTGVSSLRRTVTSQAVEPSAGAGSLASPTPMDPASTCCSCQGPCSSQLLCASLSIGRFFFSFWFSWGVIDAQHRVSVRCAA